MSGGNVGILFKWVRSRTLNPCPNPLVIRSKIQIHWEFECQITLGTKVWSRVSLDQSYGWLSASLDRTKLVHMSTWSIILQTTQARRLGAGPTNMIDGRAKFSTQIMHGCTSDCRPSPFSYAGRELRLGN